MSLSASMWTSVSGLLVHGEKMNVIGNNIANVNTVGFKAARMDFQDFISQYVGTAAGMGQVGRGASIGIIMNDFSQGSFETTTDTTDVAITGNGFFSVKPKNSNMDFYTRAGNFRFDKDGYLVDPHGYVVQGWQMNDRAQSIASSVSAGGLTTSAVATGAPGDVKLDTFHCMPKHTTNMTLELNLDSSDINDRNVYTPAPFASMFNTWDATPDASGDTTPLGPASYSYPATMEVFDEGGQSHKVTVYFDRVTDKPAGTVSNLPDNKIMWEYVVTMDPSEDVRNFTSGGTVNQKDKGILMAGTMTFNSTGAFEDMTGFVPTEGGANFRNMSTWVQAPISANGFPSFAPNFSGTPGASEATLASPMENPAAKGRLIELNLGLRTKSLDWDHTVPNTSVATFDQIGNNYNNTTGLGQNAQLLKTHTTSNTDKTGNDFVQRFAAQNGYTFGELRYVNVDQNGILSASYSNGVSLDIFQLTLYDFPSKQNLHREGGNLFTETRNSGLPISGAPGTGGFGTTQSTSIEQSNVDLAREFVQMITTQRGFQANSKSVTTVDTMLDTVINMKR